jgi:hypothetical protein
VNRVRLYNETIQSILFVENKDLIGANSVSANLTIKAIARHSLFLVLILTKRNRTSANELVMVYTCTFLVFHIS